MNKELVFKSKGEFMEKIVLSLLFAGFYSLICPQVTIFKAKKIITMNPAQPEANAVAVKDGKILSVGRFKYLVKDFKDSAAIDRQFEDDVIVPGFIEAHMHPQIAGFFWQYLYVGFFDRYDPDGNFIKGCRSKKEVLDRIANAVKLEKHKEGWVIAWGYQSEFYEHEPLTVDELNPISGDYKVCVENANMHAMYVNKHGLDAIGVTPQTDIEGVGMCGGRPTGVLLELKAMRLALKHLPNVGFEDMCNITRAASRLAHRVGVTTMTDLAAGLSFLTHGFEAYFHEVPKDDFPQRVALFPVNGLAMTKGIDYIKSLHKKNNDKLWFDAIKFLTDGSLQCHTAHVQWPAYHNCACNGMENIPLDQLMKQWMLFHEAGFRVALHVNGSQAIEQALQAAKYVLNRCPRIDHRHSFEHNQMVTEAQLARMKTLGLVANFFINHIYYWGDIHVENLGYRRAAHLNPLASALRHGVPFSIHSDASVTPVDPLFTMWVAVNRLRSSGKVLGSAQRISVYDALKAVTLDAAYILGKEDVLGSIEVGKYADFAILDKNPLTVKSLKIKDICVKATVLGGKVFTIMPSPSWRYFKFNKTCTSIISQFCY